jgi:hypothetical protein
LKMRWTIWNPWHSLLMIVMKNLPKHKRQTPNPGPAFYLFHQILRYIRLSSKGYFTVIQVKI